jgi:hypothetical protein
MNQTSLSSLSFAFLPAECELVIALQLQRVDQVHVPRLAREGQARDLAHAEEDLVVADELPSGGRAPPPPQRSRAFEASQ